jgi:hypothetical protein
MMVVMASKVDPHCGTEMLEEYSSGRLSENAIAEVEEHLLICTQCRARLEASEAYTTTMRLASQEIRRKQRNSKLTVAASNPLK